MNFLTTLSTIAFHNNLPNSDFIHDRLPNLGQGTSMTRQIIVNFLTTLSTIAFHNNLPTSDFIHDRLPNLGQGTSMTLGYNYSTSAIICATMQLLKYVEGVIILRAILITLRV